MVTYLAIIAALNLCIGYALGAYIGVLPGLTPLVAPPIRVRRANEPPLNDSRPVVEPVRSAPDSTAVEDVATPTTPIDSASLSSPDVAPDDTSSTEDETSAATTDADDPPAAASSPAGEAPSLDSAVEETSADDRSLEAPPDAVEPSVPEDDEQMPEVNLDEFMAGLAAFQAQLASVDEHLQTSGDDSEALEHCVDQLQTVGGEYLEQAHSALDKLGQASEPTPDSAQLQQAILDQTEKVEKDTLELGAVDIQQDSAKVREQLIATSQGWAESTVELQATLDSSDPQGAPEMAGQRDNAGAPDLTRDDMTNLSTREFVEQAIHDYCTSGPVDGQRLMVALVDVDHTESINTNHGEAIGDRLILGLTRLVEQTLNGQQMVARYSGQQLIVILPDATPEAACDQLEQIRQQVETTQFVADNTELSMTITCALAEANAERGMESLLSNLDETLREAKRDGRNRSFYHSGTTASRVVPPALEMSADRREV